MSLDSTVNANQKIFVISVRKKEYYTEVLQNLVSLLQILTFKNVAPVKKDIGFSSSPQKKIDFFQNWEEFCFDNLCNGHDL